MRYLLLAVLFLPSFAHAFVSYTFDGIVGSRRPHDQVKNIQEGQAFTGSLSLGDSASVLRQGEDYCFYQTQGNFVMDFGGMRLVQNGPMDVFVKHTGDFDGVQVKIYDGQWSDNGEAGFGWYSWAYPLNTFDGVAYDNVKTNVDPLGGTQLTAVYRGGEVFDDWESAGDINIKRSQGVTSAALDVQVPDPNEEAPVPEPSTFYLLGMGLSGLGLLRFKRRA